MLLKITFITYKIELIITKSDNVGPKTNTSINIPPFETHNHENNIIIVPEVRTTRPPARRANRHRMVSTYANIIA